MSTNDRPLAGRIALVAGATRGASRAIAIQLGAAGATVYCSGRSTAAQRSELDRPETIEQTAELVEQAGGVGVAVRTDHLDPAQVEQLVARIEREQGRLDLLVNGIWGQDHVETWGKPMWEHELDLGLRTLRQGLDTHAITSRFALPLLIGSPGGLVIELTDGTYDYNAARYRNSYYFDLVKWGVLRMAFAQASELEPHGATAVALTPGWLRSEAMLEHFGVTEETWRDALANVPHFAISESPAFVGRAAVALATDPQRARWNGQSLSSGQLAQAYGFDDVDGSRPDGWRYMVEVADAGRPADTSGYR